MKDLKYDKNKLLDIIQANRNQHETEFLEAWKNWRNEFEDKVAELLGEASLVGPLTDPFKKNYIDFQPVIDLWYDQPKHYLEEYDRVLEMLELSDNNVVELNSNDFNCYIQDNWAWKQDFTSNSGKYR